jgi:hypothetical protein
MDSTKYPRPALSAQVAPELTNWPGAGYLSVYGPPAGGTDEPATQLAYGLPGRAGGVM